MQAVVVLEGTGGTHTHMLAHLTCVEHGADTLTVSVCVREPTQQLRTKLPSSLCLACCLRVPRLHSEPRAAVG
jgi:1-aminocyclopropane-1-carboxylate deaminase/D-cysteine desulfhydrase-like pyridoxal-dependent ACC family enzyme